MKLGFCIKNKTEKKAGIVLNHGMNKDLNGAECLWRIQANTCLGPPTPCLIFTNCSYILSFKFNIYIYIIYYILTICDLWMLYLL